MASQTLAQELEAQLNLEHLRPTAAWLKAFLQSVDHTRPLATLRSTARYRILASDITEAVQNNPPTILFPHDIANGNVKERRVTGPILVQVLDVEDIGRSRWSQVEAIEAAERGETTKGREVIRVVPSEDSQSAEGITAPMSDLGATSVGPHKLLLQDAAGKQIYGFESSSIDGLNLNMSIGFKMLLKDIVLARGVVMLEPRNVQLLGGKIDRLHKAWKEERKEKLKLAAGIMESR